MSSLRESQRRERLRTRVGRFTDEIVSLQAENRQLNAENQALADRFNKLTEYNQVLGDDLATLDAETVYLENMIEYKRRRVKRYTGRGDNLQATLAKYRKTLLEDDDIAPMVEKIKKIEAMRISVVRQFQELKGERIDKGLEDAKTAAKHKLEAAKDRSNDLLEQKKLLEMLIDPKVSVRKKKDKLARMIREKEREQQELVDLIDEIKEENMANLRRKRMSSEVPMDSEAGTIDEQEKEYHNQQRMKLLQKDPKSYDAMEKKMIEECGDDKNGSESESMSATGSRRRPHSRRRHHEETERSRSQSRSGKRSSAKRRREEDESDSRRASKRSSASSNRRSRSESRSTSRGSMRARSPSPPKNEKSDEEVQNVAYANVADDDRVYFKRCMKVLDPKLAVEAGTQTNDNDAEQPLVTQDKLESFSKQKQDAETRLGRLSAELENKKQEKKNVQDELKGLLPKLITTETYGTSIAPDPNAVKDLSLKLFQKHTKEMETDLTGKSIEFHEKLLADQMQQLEATQSLEKRVESLREQVMAASQKVEAQRQLEAEKDNELQQVKNDLKSATNELDRDQINEDLEKEMTRQMQNDISDLSKIIREKQLIIEERTSRNEDAQEKLEDLLRKRESYERDVEDMAQREKPEIQSLAHQVHASQTRERESKENLESMEELLRDKRSQLGQMKNSQELQDYNDIILKRMKLERRLTKWQMLSKCARDTVQGLEAYSIENRQKRKALAKNLEQCQKAKIAKDEELRKAELYAELLTDLIRAHNNNWT